VLTKPSSERGRFSYAAFISYNRGVDTTLAEALQGALHQFAKPWYRLRALRVFRDDASLSANPGLWPSVQAALDESEFFVLLASPQAAQSEWVEREVRHWLSRNPPTTIMVALTGGNLVWDEDKGDFDWKKTTALPDVLRGTFADEPRYVDLRQARTLPDYARSRAFKLLVADLAAPMHHKSKDDMIGEDVRVHRRNRTWASAAIAGLVVLTIAATVFGVDSRLQTARAEQQTRAATARQLMAQAEASAAQNPRMALRLGLAAYGLVPGPETRSALFTQLAGTAYAGTLTGHTGRVATVDFSPDGRLLASAGDDVTIVVWDLMARGGPRQLGSPLTEHTLGIDSVAFSPDGRTLASASADGSVILWDVSDPDRGIRSTARLDVGTVAVGSVAFSPDGSILAASTSDGSVLLWRVTATGQPARLATLSGKGQGDGATVAFSPTAALLAVNTAGAVGFWDLSNPGTPRRVATIPTDDARSGATSMAFSPAGGIFATAKGNDTVVLWNLDAPQRPSRLGTLTLDEFDSDGEIAISADGSTLASSRFDGIVRLWDISDPRKPEALDGALTGHTGTVGVVAFSPEGHTLVTAGYDSTIMMWDVGAPNRPHRLGAVAGSEQYTPLRSAAFSSDGGIVAAAQGRSVMLGRPVAGQPGRYDTATAADGNSGDIMSVAFAPDARTLASADWDGHIVLWDIHDPARPQELTTINADLVLAVNSVAFSPSAGVLVAGCDNGTIIVWDVTDGSAPRQLSRQSTGSPGAIRSVRFSPNGHLLAVASSDKTVTLWSMTDPARPERIGAPLAGHTGDVTAVAFSHDGTRLASASRDQTVILWDVADPEHPHRVGAPWIGHRSSVDDVAFSPDDRTVVSAANDSVRLWYIGDTGQARPLGVPLPRETANESIALSPDGQVLATAAFNGSLNLWDVSRVNEMYDATLLLACRYAAGSLGPADWQELVPAMPYLDPCALK
jgi:WD40 repeat protein